MIEKIGGVIAIILGIFSFGYLKGRNNERNKSFKRAVKVVKKANKIRKDIDKIPTNKLDDTYDKLCK